MDCLSADTVAGTVGRLFFAVRYARNRMKLRQLTIFFTVVVMG